MPEVPDLPRPSQLWKQLTPERKLQAATAFWTDDNAGVEQMEAVATIAARIKFRTKSVYAMPVDKKARQLAALAGVSEMVAARLLVAYHLSEQRPMMGSFLDALGIKHEDGLIRTRRWPPRLQRSFARRRRQSPGSTRAKMSRSISPRWFGRTPIPGVR